MLDVDALARQGYEAYAAFTGGKTWDGRPMPTWEGLTDRIRGAWFASAAATLQSATNAWLETFQRRGKLLREAMELLLHEPPEEVLRDLVARVRAELGIGPDE